jgi:hypothetical protein
MIEILRGIMGCKKMFAIFRLFLIINTNSYKTIYDTIHFYSYLLTTSNSNH